MRIVQASPSDPIRAIESAWIYGCRAIAWDLRQDCDAAVHAAKAARLRSEGWYSVERVAAPSHDCPADEKSFDQAREHLLAAMASNAWCDKLWLAGIQDPTECGCIRCRDGSARFGGQAFFESVLEAFWEMDRPVQVSPVLWPEPGPPIESAAGAGESRPDLLERFRAWNGSLFVPHVGLLLMRDSDGADEDAWPFLAHCQSGADLFPCVGPQDADRFENCMVVL